MIVVDANIIRRLAHGNIDGNGFRAFKEEGGSVHIADSAIVEVLGQICAGGFSWEVWQRGLRELDGFLDEDRPFLVGGRELLATIGIRLDSDPVEQRETYVAHNKRAWEFIRVANSVGDLRSFISRAPVVVADEKKKWTDRFGSGRERAEELEFSVEAQQESAVLDEFVRASSQAIDDAVSPCSPLVSVRLDAFIRVDALLWMRNLKSKDPYNAKKEANDVFDTDLLRYLALPAAICTDDGGIHHDLAASGSWQRSWVVRSSDLNAPNVRAHLKQLRWPTATIAQGQR